MFYEYDFRASPWVSWVPWVLGTAVIGGMEDSVYRDIMEQLACPDYGILGRMACFCFLDSPTSFQQIALGKWPIYSGLPIKMVIFHGYVKVPEGSAYSRFTQLFFFLHCFTIKNMMRLTFKTGSRRVVPMMFLKLCYHHLTRSLNTSMNRRVP